MEHHPIFSGFPRWQGEPLAGYSFNFLGAKTRDSFFLQETNAPPPTERKLAPDYPAFDEEYFEWIDLLESVAAARERFTMIELGAGYGRWLVNASLALKCLGSVPSTLIGVEAEPEHYQWMKEHLRDNGLDPDRATLIQAAVSDRDGWVPFHTGNAERWYGQAIVTQKCRLIRMVPGFLRRSLQWLRGRAVDDFSAFSKIKKVRAVGLDTLLEPLAIVDLIDLDIQGSELSVLQGSMELLTAKVKRVHIGTHGKGQEAGLRRCFSAAGWEKLNDYACGSEAQTPYGPIKFQDGVQTWKNSSPRRFGSA